MSARSTQHDRCRRPVQSDHRNAGQAPQRAHPDRGMRSTHLGHLCVDLRPTCRGAGTIGLDVTSTNTAWSIVATIGASAEIEPAVFSRRGSGVASVHARAAITRFIWLASAAVANNVARSATPTVSRNWAAMAGHAGVAVAAMQSGATETAEHSQLGPTILVPSRTRTEDAELFGVQIAHHVRIGHQDSPTTPPDPRPRESLPHVAGCCA